MPFHLYPMKLAYDFQKLAVWSNMGIFKSIVFLGKGVPHESWGDFLFSCRGFLVSKQGGFIISKMSRNCFFFSLLGRWNFTHTHTHVFISKILMAQRHFCDLWIEMHFCFPRCQWQVQWRVIEDHCLVARPSRRFLNRSTSRQMSCCDVTTWTSRQLTNNLLEKVYFRHFC